MKKIFLTSGLVLCLACPALAASDITTDINETTGAYKLASGADATCQEPTLGVTSGSQKFYAKWKSKWHTIALNVNAAGGAAAGASVLPTTLYSVNDANSTKIYTGIDEYGDLLDGVAATEDLLTTNPAGKELTYTLNYKIPTGHTLDDLTEKTEVIPDTRAFEGFNDAQDGTGNKVIDEDGKLLQAGVTQAATYDNNNHTWYAQYALATPSIDGDPVLPGYTFGGWFEDEEYETEYEETARADSAILYAKWTAAGFKLKYRCGEYHDGNVNRTNSFYKEDYTAESAHDISYTYDTAGAAVLSASAVCGLDGYSIDEEEGYNGWSCVIEGTETPVEIADITGTGNPWTVANNVVCTANWIPNEIGLTWKIGVGSTRGTAGADKCTYDLGIGVEGAPTRAGYDFEGWSTTPTEGVTYEADPVGFGSGTDTSGD